MHRQIKRYLLVFFGILFVILAVVGAILPILPTTPFVILAASCFAKSSPRFHQILLTNRWFGATLLQWEQSRTIARSAKKKAMIVVISTFALSIAVLHGKLELQLGLLIMGSILLFFIWRLKEAEVVLVPENK